MQNLAAHAKMVERPTLLLLHGGPGLDHATYELGLHEMSDVAQVIVYDHREQGRNGRRTADERSLGTWAEDVAQRVPQRVRPALHAVSGEHVRDGGDGPHPQALCPLERRRAPHDGPPRRSRPRSMSCAGSRRRTRPGCPMTGSEEVVASLPAASCNSSDSNTAVTECCATGRSGQGGPATVHRVLVGRAVAPLDETPIRRRSTPHG